MIKKILTGVVLVGLSMAVADGVIITKYKNKSVLEQIKYVKMLNRSIKSNVKTRLKNDPSGQKAIRFCINTAKELAKDMSKKYPENIKIRKASLRYRDPANKPDAIDTKILTNMTKSAADGNLSIRPVLVGMDNGTVRIYQPIVTQKSCLKCHGDRRYINRRVMKIIRDNFPKDKATGFHQGDLQGVSIVEVAPLPK